jgi:hypothetical protein
VLFGVDPVTGKNYDHRRGWITGFEQKLAGLFGIEVAFHAELNNHLHVVIRTRPDIVATWSDEEVVRRYLSINLLVRNPLGELPRQPTDLEIACEMADPQRVKFMRDSLSSVSKFMGSLCEHIARRANREDEVTGRFWEGRFGCRSLEDESAVLVCGIYVDLNQIRAGETTTPEESRHTSAYDRIQARLQPIEVAGEATTGTASMPADGWMCKLSLHQGLDADVRQGQTSATPWRASDRGILSMSLDEYLELLDWSGRTVREGKSGSIPNHLAPILVRLGINVTHWTDLVTRFDEWFGRVVGRASRVLERARQAGRRYYRGQARCAMVFG